MRFSTLVVSGSLAVLAAAVPAGTETSGAAPAQTTSAMDACLNKCPVNDVNCKAHCIAVCFFLFLIRWFQSQPHDGSPFT